MLKRFDDKDRLVAESEAAYAMDVGAWCFLPLVQLGPRTPLQILQMDLHVDDAHLRALLARGRATR